MGGAVASVTHSSATIAIRVYSGVNSVGDFAVMGTVAAFCGAVCGIVTSSVGRSADTVGVSTSGTIGSRLAIASVACVACVANRAATIAIRVYPRVGSVGDFAVMGTVAAFCGAMCGVVASSVSRSTDTVGVSSSSTIGSRLAIASVACVACVANRAATIAIRVYSRVDSVGELAVMRAMGTFGRT